MTNIQKLEQLGQSIWYDNISRSVILKGELKQMVDQGLLGVTSNPTIFDKAISGSDDYDEQIRGLVESKQDIDAGEIIQALMVKDIQMACDVLKPVYERTKGRDGYVSVEVTPSKARKTEATIEEVRELWKLINRKNLMVKIPATKEGLPAIEQSISEGININVTLIFSVDRYREVTGAYISGLEKRMKAGNAIDHVASVASVFVSRIDTLVDELLEKKGTPAAKDLRGKVAVANTKMVYQAFVEIFKSERWEALRAKGARVQRPLWGSTGTKNPEYSDLLYVNTLIGPHTVNTVPPQTYSAILDHAKPELTVESNLDEARRILEGAEAQGVDMKWVLQKLEEDGVAAFEKSFDGLYANLSKKKKEILESSVPTE